MNDFLNNLLGVAGQVLILFILVCLGFICGKVKVLNDTAVKVISDLCLMFATPAVIINSFIRPFNETEAFNYLLAAIAAVICHGIGILCGHLIFHTKDIKRKAVMRGASMLSNAGFMGLPLQLALLGTIGAFYASAYATVLTIFLWTYGVYAMSYGKDKLNLKKILLNPGIIAVLIGVPLFILPIEVPDIIKTAVTHVSNLNTPLPMIVIGYYLSKISFKSIFSKKAGLEGIAVSLLLVPLISLFVLYVLGFRGDLFTSSVISISAPVAVAVTMFTVKYDGDIELSTNIVSISTLFSIITMPIIVALAQTIA